jgi:hypothetical protein
MSNVPTLGYIVEPEKRSIASELILSAR